MKAKKTLCLLLACILCLALFAACGKTETNGEDGQNPVMNFIGKYMNDRCELTLEADGADGAKISAYWGDTARDGFQWELTGTFDADAKRINYTDAVKKSVTYTDVDVFEVNEVLFENGKGYIQINEDGTLTWNDEQDADMAFEPFEFVAPEADDVTEPASADTTEPVSEDAVEEDGGKPLADFVGTYASGRCTIEVTADGETDANITVDWSSSAAERSHWTMRGSYDSYTWRIHYSDGVKANQVFAESGEIAEETVEYEDGYGRIQFHDDGTLSWEDEKEADNILGMVFTRVKS